MDLAEYRRHIDALGFGKRLPTAVYLYRDAGVSLGEELDQLIARVIAAFEITVVFKSPM